MPEGTLNPVRSAVNVARSLIEGRFRMPTDRIGEPLTTDGGQTFTIYRETTVEPRGRDSQRAMAVLAFQFHLWFMPDPLVPIAVRVFEPLSILTTPFFAGLPGFRTKLWLFDHDTGDYLGIYQWENPEMASRYARALRKLMAVFAAPGTVSYGVFEDTSLDAYLESHTPAEETSESWVRFLGGSLSVGAILAGVLHVAYWKFVRPWYLHWGTTEAERQRQLPGHDFVPVPAVQNTQAVTIDAPPEAVWPWLIQIGAGRAGFYSYGWLERLIGTDERAADRIVSEYQDLEEGEEVAFAPTDRWAGSSPAWPVVAELVENERLVLRPPGDRPSYVWSFQLTSAEAGQTRLVTRVRSRQKSTVVGRLIDGLTAEPAHFLIQRKMLLGIKNRSEQKESRAVQ